MKNKPSEFLMIDDKVLIKKIDEERTYGNIFIPDTVEDNNSWLGEMISIGPGFKNLAGLKPERFNMQTKVGDIVAFPRFGGTKLVVHQNNKDEEYIIMREADILCIVDRKE